MVHCGGGGGVTSEGGRVNAFPHRSSLSVGATAAAGVGRTGDCAEGQDLISWKVGQKTWYKTALTAPPLFYYICDPVLFFWLHHQNFTPKIRNTGFRAESVLRV